MKIYLDYVFLINFIFDFIIVYGTKYILKETTKISRILYSSLFGGFSIILLFFTLNSLSLFIIKLFISIIMILIAFGTNNFFKKLIYFYLISIILGGSLYLLNITYIYDNKGLMFYKNGLSINFIVMLVVSPIIIYLYIKENRNYRLKYSNIYNIEININNRSYKLKSILDSGNHLKSPFSKKNIILVNNKINISNLKYVYVPYKSLNNRGVIKCYKPDKVIINEKEINNCLIGISKDKFSMDGIDCILPNDIKEDL